MTSSSPNSDEALLARLNALRASSVNLSHSEAPLSIPKPIQTPETSLSSRLKALRTASESSVASLPRPSSPPPTPAPISPKDKGPRPSMSSSHHDHGSASVGGRSAVAAIFDDSARQVESLLSDIKGTKFENDPDADLKLARESTEVAYVVGRELRKQMQDGRQAARSDDAVKTLGDDASAALERARKTLAAQDAGTLPMGGAEQSDKSNDSDEVGSQRHISSNNSDDEADKPRDIDEDEEADAILAELMDDVALDFEEEANNEDQKVPGVGSPPKLPPPPSLITPMKSISPEYRNSTAADSETQNVDDANDDKFQRLMKARMSALRTLSPGLELPTAPSSAPFDALGLPSAPTTAVSSSDATARRKQPKDDYICNICYAPATIFCEGCEEDFEEWDTKDDAMYCARCWKEAHLGKTAGDEERQHNWVVLRKGN